MKVLDSDNLLDGTDTVLTNISDTQTQISTVQRAVRDITGLDDFTGKTGESIRSFFGTVHQPFLVFLHQSLTDYSLILKNMQKSVNVYDTNPTALVGQDFIEQEVLSNLEETLKQTEDIITKANTAIRSVSDIIPLPQLKPAQLAFQVDAGKRQLRTTVDKLHQLDAEQVSALDPVQDDLDVMKNLLTDIEFKLKNGDLSVNNYNVEAIRNIDAYHVVMESVYGDVENHPIDSKSRKQIELEKDAALEELDEDEQFYLNKAYDDFENGEIDNETFESIQSGILQTGAAFIQRSINKVVTDNVVNEAADGLHSWIQRNTTAFMDRDLALMTTSGNVIDHAKKPGALRTIVRTGARNGVPFLGSAVDFGIQVSQGEDMGDAAIKTAGHLAAGATGAKVGLMIGGGFGLAAGFAIGVVGSMAFDWVYDNKDKIVDTAKNIGSSIVDAGKSAIDSIGDAVTGFFGNLGSAFK